MSCEEVAMGMNTHSCELFIRHVVLRVHRNAGQWMNIATYAFTTVEDRTGPWAEQTQVSYQ